MTPPISRTTLTNLTRNIAHNTGYPGGERIARGAGLVRGGSFLPSPARDPFVGTARSCRGMPVTRRLLPSFV